MRNVLLTVLLTSLLTSAAATAQIDPTEKTEDELTANKVGHYTAERLSAEQMKLILESQKRARGRDEERVIVVKKKLSDKQKKRLKKQKRRKRRKNKRNQEQEPKKKRGEIKDLLDFWLGSRADLTSIMQVTLEFEHPNYDPKAEDERKYLPPFKAYLTYENDRLTVRTNTAPHKKLRGGLRGPFRPLGRQDMYLKGLAKTSLLAMLLDYGSETNRAAFICPVIYSPGADSHVSTDETPVFSTGYKLSRIYYRIDAVVEGGFDSGSKIGKAKAWLHSTPNIFPSKPFRDSDESRQPRVDLRYLPGGAAERKGLISEFNGAWIGGIQVGLELESAIGLKRRVESEAVVEIREHVFHDVQSVDLEGGAYFKMGKATCYLLSYRDLDIEYRFDSRNKKGWTVESSSAESKN